MSDALMEAYAQRAARMNDTMAQPRWGVVTSVDPAGPYVRVKLKPEDVLTGWLPVLASGAGGGWSVLTVPTPGMQALVIFDLGDAQNGVVIGFAHTTNARPAEVPASEGAGGTVNPTATPLAAGETVLTGPGGQVIRIGPAGIYMRGTVRIDGDLRVNGHVRDKTGTLDGLRQHYNAHRHAETGSTTQTTDAPDP